MANEFGRHTRASIRLSHRLVTNGDVLRAAYGSVRCVMTIIDAIYCQPRFELAWLFHPRRADFFDIVCRLDHGQTLTCGNDLQSLYDKQRRPLCQARHRRI